MHWRLLWILTGGAAVGLMVLVFNPLHSQIFNLAWLGCLLVLMVGALILTWRRTWLRGTLLLLVALSGLVFLLPSREVDREALHARYLDQLRASEGIAYFWGGESGRGIDCSGLPRRALREALLVTGLKNGDGGCLRLYLQHWWHDASARALSEGYRAYTTSLQIEGKIADMAYTDLLPGDLAVTIDGTHLLVYLGEDHWIQADPGLGKVAILNGRKDRNPWFQIPTTLHRWQVLMP